MCQLVYSSLSTHVSVMYRLISRFPVIIVSLLLFNSYARVVANGVCDKNKK